MNERVFVDYYEVLQVSQNADAETLERVYRLLAKRYHPDNHSSGDADRFNEVHEAWEVLSNPKSRAAYDVKYDDNRSIQWKIFDQGSAEDGRADDRRIFHGVLSLLYVARRRDPKHGGLGAVSLEKLLGVPRQHLEFPIWYLRQRGWVETLDTGQYGITVSGVDKLSDRELALPEDRLLAASSVVGVKPEEGGVLEGAPGQPRALGESTRAAAGPKAPPVRARPAAWAAAAPEAPAEMAPEVAPAREPKLAAASEFPSEEDGAPAGAADETPDEVRQARDRARAVADRLRTRR